MRYIAIGLMISLSGSLSLNAAWQVTSEAKSTRASRAWREAPLVSGDNHSASLTSSGRPNKQRQGWRGYSDNSDRTFSEHNNNERNNQAIGNSDRRQGWRGYWRENDTINNNNSANRLTDRGQNGRWRVIDRPINRQDNISQDRNRLINRNEQREGWQGYWQESNQPLGVRNHDSDRVSYRDNARERRGYSTRNTLDHDCDRCDRRGCGADCGFVPLGAFPFSMPLYFMQAYGLGYNFLGLLNFFPVFLTVPPPLLSPPAVFSPVGDNFGPPPFGPAGDNFGPSPLGPGGDNLMPPPFTPGPMS